MGVGFGRGKGAGFCLETVQGLDHVNVSGGAGRFALLAAELDVGDQAAGDHLQGRAVRVVAEEGLDRVIVGDVADAALEGDGLLDLAGLAQAPDVRLADSHCKLTYGSVTN